MSAILIGIAVVRSASYTGEMRHEETLHKIAQSSVKLLSVFSISYDNREDVVYRIIVINTHCIA